MRSLITGLSVNWRPPRPVVPGSPGQEELPITPLFGFTQALEGLSGAHPCWGGLSPLIQMLV